MTEVGIGVETLQGVKPERIVWLPTITLGYIYTLSGDLTDFALAVVAIGCARFFTDLIRTEHEAGELIDRLAETVTKGSDSSTFMIWFFAFLVMGYILAAGRSFWSLYIYFTHTDLILVGIAAIHWGTLIVVVTSLVSLFAGTPFDERTIEEGSTSQNGREEAKDDDMTS